jgi:hypothetical protein
LELVRLTPLMQLAGNATSRRARPLYLTISELKP